jgi:hypothetical protein
MKATAFLKKSLKIHEGSVTEIGKENGSSE